MKKLNKLKSDRLNKTELYDLVFCEVVNAKHPKKFLKDLRAELGSFRLIEFLELENMPEAEGLVLELTKHGKTTTRRLLDKIERTLTNDKGKKQESKELRQ